MAEYRRSVHAVSDLKYHVVWITKYRYKILKGRLAERARGLDPTDVSGARVLVCDGGAVDEQTVREYLENQKWEEDEEGFQISVPAEP